MGHTVDHDPSLSLFNPEELIRVRMDLAAKFFARLDRHQNQLQSLPRMQNSAEVGVRCGQLFEIRVVSNHDCAPNSSMPKPTIRQIGIKAVRRGLIRISCKSFSSIGFSICDRFTLPAALH